MKKDREAGEFKKYTKKEQLLLDREINRLEKFFGGLAVLTGVYLQEAALLIAINMLVATFVKKFHMKKNWVDGFELDLALLALALTLALYGAGDWVLL